MSTKFLRTLIHRAFVEPQQPHTVPLVLRVLPDETPVK